MSFPLADVFSPSPQPSKPVNPAMAAPAERDSGSFAEALTAFRAEDKDTSSGEAGLVLPGAMLTGLDVPAPTPDAAVTDGSTLIAGLVIPVTPAQTVVADFTNTADMALKLAGNFKLDPPTLGTQDAGQAGQPAAVAGAPQDSAEALTREALDALVARATAQGEAAKATTSAPQAAQGIASTPHVVSVQGSVVADTLEAPADIAAPSSTEQDAADAALAVLTKDKTSTKVKAEAPDAAVSATAPEDAEAPKPVTANAAPVKPADAQTEPDTAEKKPAVEKPAAAAGQNTAPSQAPAADKLVLADAGAKPQPVTQALAAAAIPHIASEMASHVKKGATRFEIRLDPPELGRIDVRIDIDQDGKVTSRLMVEKSETLDLLKADQRALERALHEAGFKSEQNSLSFSLKDDRAGGQAKFEDLRELREQTAAHIDIEEEPARLAAGSAYRASGRGQGGFDLRV